MYLERPRNWRDYQKDHRNGLQRRHLRMRLPWLGVWALGFVLMLVVLGYSGTWISAHLSGATVQGETGLQEQERQVEKLRQEDLAGLLRSLDFTASPLSDKYLATRNGVRFSIETSLVPSVQSFVRDVLHRSLTVRAAMVVLNPATGEVLAIADHENGRGKENGSLCLRAEYPAASLFKIVAAAAAIEARGLSPETMLSFRGRKYTLYHSQLKAGVDRSDTRMTLKEAFSASINPVFGKIGIHELGRDLMERYAERFLFNQPIPFELPLDVSPIEMPEDDYGLAEIASGFNKKTLISPLHAALLSAAVANRGAIMEPRFVKSVRDEEGRLLYEGEPCKLAGPISADTARKMRVLMGETVDSGTARKAFRPIQGKPPFRSVELGAKTGTINDVLDQHRVDWITTYAIPEGEDAGICVATLAIHGERLGRRAKDMTRAVIEHYFSSSDPAAAAGGISRAVPESSPKAQRRSKGAKNSTKTVKSWKK